MIQIGTEPLSIVEIENVAVNGFPVGQQEKSKKAIERAYQLVQDNLKDPDKVVYGINTGFGHLKSVRIATEDVRPLQVNLIRSHAVGVGKPLSIEVVRAMMLLRAQTLSMGHSGVANSTIELLLAMLNKKITPMVPCQGSVGASGDLAPLSHLALCLIGEGEVFYEGQRQPTAQAFKKTGLKAIEPQAKEALALINGTQMMTAIGCLNWQKASRLLHAANVAAAISIEATLGSKKAFDPRVHALRPHTGQQKVAAAVYSLLERSEIGASHEDCGRVQDAYSFRCVPQVHGVAEDMLEFTGRSLTTEINSVTDNPLLFPDSGEFISAGNFHGQPISFAMDMMSMALTTLASISERRVFRLLFLSLSDLPMGLIDKSGLQSGMIMLQVTSAALVSECKVLSHPASVDSIPTWAEQEDHVSMGAHAARKAEQIIENLSKVIAIELMCAVQGMSFRRPQKTSLALEKVIAKINALVPPVTTDRVMAQDIERLSEEILTHGLEIV